VERFGAQFFREIPRNPGVYLMHGAGRLLYVGKAGNLRQRLGSYRYTSDRTSRKTLRLLNAVESISWEVHPSEPAACLRENQLLREQRPKFNRVNTWPRAYPFIELRRDKECFSLRITTEPTEHCHGAFKGNGRAAFASLLRLLWSAFEANHRYENLPRELVLAPPPTEWVFTSNLHGAALLHDFLSGTADTLLREFELENVDDSVFHRQFRKEDVAVLTAFFAMGPLRNKHWRETLALNGSRVEQEELDDLPFLARCAGFELSSDQQHQSPSCAADTSQ
jgi:hypothetical protein